MVLGFVVFGFVVVSLFAVLARSMDRVVSSQSHVIEELKKMTDVFKDIPTALAALQTDVANETTVVQGAVTLLNGIPALISAAVSQAQAAGATPAQLQAFTDLSDQIVAQSSQLAAAVASAPNGNVTPGAGVTNPAPTN